MSRVLSFVNKTPSTAQNAGFSGATLKAFSEEQLTKASVSIVVSDAGSITETKPEAPKNAEFPMFFSDAGSITEVKLSQ